MSQQCYRVVFSGQLRPGHDLASVKQRLSQSFQMPLETLDRYFTGRPVVLRSGLDAEQAERFRRAFASAGAELEVEALPAAAAAPVDEAAPTAAAPGPTPPASAAPASPTLPAEMSCPRCGARQPTADSCARCGVIIAKAQQRATRVTHQSPPAADLVPAPATVARAPVSAASPLVVETRAEPAVDDAEAAADHPPVLEIRDLSVVGLLATALVAGLLNLLLVGMLLAPRMVWDFIVSHVRVDDSRLGNDDLWLGLRPLLWTPVAFLVGMVAMIPVGVVYFFAHALSPRLATGLLAVLQPGVLIVMAAPVALGVIRSMVGHTLTRNGDRVFSQPFLWRRQDVLRFLREEWRQLLLGGFGLFASLLFFTAPLGTAVVLTWFFSRMQANGFRYHLELPWRKALIWSLIALPTLGFANLWFIRIYLREVLPGGRWLPSG